MGEALVETLDDADLGAERTRARDDEHDGPGEKRDETVDRDRPFGMSKGAPRQRLDQAWHRSDVRPAQLLKEPVRRIREPQPERHSDVAVPGTEQHFTDAAALPLRRHHHVHAPRALHLAALHGQPHGHRRVLADDCRTFARQPDLGFTAGVVRVAPVLPFPAQAAGLCGIAAEHTPIQRVHCAAILGPVAIDVWNGHAYAPDPACASTYSMFEMQMSRSRPVSRTAPATARGSRLSVPDMCSSSRRPRTPACAICARSRVTVTFSSR